MAQPRTIILDGKAWLWVDVLRQRREQLAAWREAQQPVLFALRVDCRPVAERRAKGRYRAPSLFER